MAHVKGARVSLFSPVGHTLFSRLVPRRTVADVCIDSFEIGEPAKHDRRAAFHLEDSLDRVTGVAPLRTMDLEHRRLLAGEMLLPACIAYVLNDVLCVDGNFYNGFVKFRVRGATRTLLASVSESIDEGVLVSNGQSHAYFGHWMTEEFPYISVAEMMGRAVTVYHGREPYKHEPGYLQLYGLPSADVLPSRCRIRRLTILGENDINSVHFAKLAEFRESRARAGWVRKSQRVFIRRGGGSARSLTNELEVIDYLSRAGFDIVDPEKLTSEEIAFRCYGASLAVGVEGSHMAHGFIQMFSGASLVLIQPPDRFNNPFKDLCDAVGINYGFAVADACGQGFTLPLERLAKTLDLVPS